MIMSQEQAFLKARAKLQALCELVARAGREGSRMDEVERASVRRVAAADTRIATGFLTASGEHVQSL